VKTAKWEQPPSCAWEAGSGRLAAGAQRRTPGQQHAACSAHIQLEADTQADSGWERSFLLCSDGTTQ